MRAALLVALKEELDALAIHPLEPADSPTLRTGRKVGRHRIQGIGDEFVPSIVDLAFLDPVALHHLYAQDHPGHWSYDRARSGGPCPDTGHVTDGLGTFVHDLGLEPVDRDVGDGAAVLRS